MKSLVWSGLILVGLCSMCFGQTDDPGCSITVSEIDADCTTGEEDCDFTAGCTTSSVFHVLCDGSAWIKAWTECPGGNCKNCAACVNIYTSGTGDLVFSCSSLPDCDEECCRVCVDPNFTAGYYIMRVCLVSCPGGDEEACCNGSCKAYGQFSSNPLSCQ